MRGFQMGTARCVSFVLESLSPSLCPSTKKLILSAALETDLLINCPPLQVTNCQFIQPFILQHSRKHKIFFLQLAITNTRLTFKRILMLSKDVFS